MPAWRCSRAGDFSQLLHQALALELPSLIVVPTDYSIDVARGLIGLGTDTVAT
jgi:acetolactate synthase I/II/III large subunit